MDGGDRKGFSTLYKAFKEQFSVNDDEVDQLKKVLAGIKKR
jgi:thymidylate synthase